MRQGRTADHEATDFLLSGEYAELHANNGDFISSFYRDVLGRVAAANGLANFVSALVAGESQAAVVDLTSTERNRLIVDELYGEPFHHPADPTSLELYSSQLQSRTYTPTRWI